MKTTLGVVSLVLALMSAGCESKPPARLHKAVWKPVGSWSGHAGIQTESFELGGRWRIRWDAKHENSPGTGSLKISVHSAVSGRPLMLAVDHRGVGHGTADVTEDPHLFYLVIEAENIDWAVTAEEPVADSAIAR